MSNFITLLGFKPYCDHERHKNFISNQFVRFFTILETDVKIDVRKVDNNMQ